jgi:hypothetical protein
MAAEIPRIQIWSFGHAPARMTALFPEGRDPDWIASVPAQVPPSAALHLLRWGAIYPIAARSLPEETIYWGVPREAAVLAGTEHGVFPAARPRDFEQRTGVRVALRCPVRFDTPSLRGEMASGETINISSTGILFTTDTPLEAARPISLYAAWPIRLEDNLPLEMVASGTLVRTTDRLAAMRMGMVTFRILDSTWL